MELSQFAINVGGRLQPLSAGMAATAEIKTGRRRIIEFLLSPLARRVEKAGRESQAQARPNLETAHLRCLATLCDRSLRFREDCA